MEDRMTGWLKSRLQRLSERWGLLRPPACDPGLPSDVADYLVDSYPQNHNYIVRQGRLVPRHKLKVRFEQLSGVYPERLESLLDLSCSKGFFVLDAANRAGCERTLGIDIDQRELEVCRSVSGFLGHGASRFEQMQLHELADSIDEFGGPFQTVLLVNSYQYLYFGSSRSGECYRDHERIFELIRRVCSGRVLFSNRTRLQDLQRSCQAEALKVGHQSEYTEEKILDAASRFFHVTSCGKIGKWPFWLLDVPGAELSAVEPIRRAA
jgi:hypothetical protein